VGKYNTKIVKKIIKGVAIVFADGIIILKHYPHGVGRYNLKELIQCQ